MRRNSGAWFVCVSEGVSEEVRRCFKCGADDFVAAPFDLPSLVAKIEAVKASGISGQKPFSQTAKHSKQSVLMVSEPVV